MNTSDRRTFLRQSATVAFGAGAISTLHGAKKEASLPSGKAEACIFIWLGGGMAQIDTLDPKRLGDPAERVAGSAYPAIESAVPGVKVCGHLPQVAQRLDRMTIVRSVNHDVIDEHGAATNRLHTGRKVSGTVIYPSIGSIITHERGPGQKGVPGYVLIGYPSVSRGPGFLGSRYSYLYLTDTTAGPAGLSRPPHIGSARQARREQLQSLVRQAVRDGSSDADPILQYDDTISESQQLAGGEFLQAFDLQGERADLRERYGSEFGQRCLLARRLVERGVRFIEVLLNLTFKNGSGWDTHNAGQLKQHLLIADLDAALATLCDDLEEKGLLEKTLIVVGTEFGRPAGFDSGGGRGHQGSAFSLLLAGGGLRHCGAFGETDELSEKVVKDPVSVADFHATIHHALGVDPHKELFDGDRPVPITDMGNPIAKLFG